MIKEWEPVIGLEVHLQLKTKTKVWCGCSADYDNADINTHTCPICLGHPGTLPRLNDKVVEYAIKGALALNCKINNVSQFDRKNYFYPDCSKNYQITQFEKTYAEDGFLEISSKSENNKKIRISKIQIEEDTAKSIHGKNETFINFNRCSMPLLEIITEPDIANSNEAYDYLTTLKGIIKYTNISDVSMELGSLRCDANISVMEKGSKVYGNRIEVKNLNSFKAVARAIDYEINRQIEVLESSGVVEQETRLWDDEAQITRIMRKKDGATDYRYFPEPDLFRLYISDDEIENVRKTMPENKKDKIERFVKDYQIPLYDAEVLTEEMEIADYFEDAVKESNNAKITSNWIMTSVLKILKENSIEITDFPISSKDLGKIIKLIDTKVISSKIAKDLFEIKLTDNRDPEVIVNEKGLTQVSDVAEIEKIVDEVIKNSQKMIEDYHNSDEGRKPRVLKGIIGQVMKATKGKANPDIVNDLIISKLK